MNALTSLHPASEWDDSTFTQVWGNVDCPAPTIPIPSSLQNENIIARTPSLLATNLSSPSDSQLPQPDHEDHPSPSLAALCPDNPQSKSNPIHTPFRHRSVEVLPPRLLHSTPPATLDVRRKSGMETLGIRRAADEIRRVKAKHNASVPISRLPTEIIRIILGYCVSHRSTGRPYKLTWLNATHVCRQWRSVALESASIWSQIDFSCPELAREMIARSRVAPLDVVVTRPVLTSRVYAVLIEATSNTGRLRTLVLPDAYHMNGVSLFPRLNKPAPLLHTLDLTAKPYDTLPRKFFAGKTPALRKLKITGFHFPLATSLLKNLTTLILKDPHEDPSINHCARCPTTQRLLEVLQLMTELETLELSNSLPQKKPATRSATKSAPRRVKLPKLRRLRLSGTLHLCNELLQNVIFPASAAVHLTCTTSFLSPSLGDHQAIALFNTLSQIYSASNDSEAFFKSLYIDTTFSPLSVKASAQSEVPEPSIWYDLETHARVSPFNLHVDLFESTGPLKAAFRAAVRALPLGQLETLHLGLSADEICSAKDMVDMFGGLGRVKTIALNQRNIYPFVEALRPSTDSNSSDEVPIFPSSNEKNLNLRFPSLETIQLNEADFGADSSTMDMLMEALAFRAGHGKPIKSLVLRECIQLYASGVERLSSSVSVDWDVVWA
ncbi:hypothetical protein V5O48_008569 [Marasmius crinis-equi]|uniref:F-box domain-containing protein n=1 Tax=Marasmius crinis-equi TaxID=585013 RepID=A0ABR3FDJ6_9AGAR